MPRILILDLETSGLDTTNDLILEIGAILYDTSHNRILKKYSTLVRHGLLQPVPVEITELTGITPTMLNKYGVDAKFALQYLNTLLSEADYVLAHNGINFDYPMLESNLIRLSLPVNHDTPKIDSCVDFPYPPSISTRKLIHLMGEHHIAPSKPAHCAIADCESLLSLMLCYDIETIIKRSQEPNVVVRAIVHKEDGPLARAVGFRWTNKKWIRTCKQSEVERIRSSCNFPVI